MGGSQPDWEAIGHVEPPDGAPNVLLVLIDDAGFGNAGTFGGPIDTPNYTRIAQQGVRYNQAGATIPIGGAGLIVAYSHSEAEKVEPAVTCAVQKAIGEAQGRHVQALKGAIADAQQKMAEKAADKPDRSRPEPPPRLPEDRE